MIMSSYFNVFAPKNDKENDKDLCWYRPKPHFARGVCKRLEGSVFVLYVDKMTSLVSNTDCNETI